MQRIFSVGFTPTSTTVTSLNRSIKMAQKYTQVSFLDLTYNSIKLTEDKRVATLAGDIDESNAPIVYLDQPLRWNKVIHFQVEHVNDSHAGAFSFVLGCTSCGTEKIQRGFYHTFSPCREDFECRGVVKQISIPRKIESISLSRIEDGGVLVKGKDAHSDKFNSFSAILKIPSEWSTFFIIMSGSAVSMRVSDSYKVRKFRLSRHSLAPDSTWFLSGGIYMDGDRLSRSPKGRKFMAVMNRPMRVDNSVNFEVTRIDKRQKGSFTFGLMKCHPKDIAAMANLSGDSLISCCNPLPSINIGSSIEISRTSQGIFLRSNETKMPIFDASKFGKSDWFLFIELTGAIDEIRLIVPTAVDPAKSKKKCAHCKEGEADHIFIPCGHYGLCESCATEKKFTECIACDTKVMTLIKMLSICD